MLDVLVIGAGPTGLTLACELVRHGIRCRIVDQLAEPVTYSKAAVVHARTMEVFDAIGLADTVAAHARTVHGINLFADGKRIAHVDYAGADSPFPYIYGISQRETEALLTAHLAALDVTVERGVSLATLAQHADRVTATLSTGATVDARWLVGCDGAHSTTRELLGISFEGAPYEEKIVQADLRIAFAQPVPDDEIAMVFGDGEALAFFPLFGDGRYRFVIFDVTGDHERAAELPTFQRALDAMLPGSRVSDPAWITSFRIHHRHAGRYRDRRVFIGGDATHIHSPAGGQGMNAGIQDAFNLAWKLALVQRGRARDAILDSYEAERSPVAASLLGGTDRMTRAMELAVSFRHPVTRALRDRAIRMVSRLSFVPARASHALAMLDVRYPDSPIVAQDHGASATEANAEAPSLRDWIAFGDGPAPGDRAYPFELAGVRVLRDRRHVALLFDGAAATAAGYANLAAIADAIAARAGDDVAAHVIVPGDERPAALPSHLSVLLDADGEVHRRYGARSECVYIVRPDGHVAYRCQPADRAKLLAYLDTIFVAAATSATSRS